MRSRSLAMLITGLLFATAAHEVAAQHGAPNGEWKTYGGDLGNTRYSPLEQINATNFSKLEVAWRFKTDSLGPTREYTFESTPLMIDGVVYSTAGSRRAVVALDAATGELLWIHRLDEGERGKAAPRQLSGRGLAYWKNGNDARILYVTPGYQLVALDAHTGLRIPTFGKAGIVDLKQNDDQDMDLVTGEVGLHATPVVAKDVVIVGAAHRTGANPKTIRNVKGYVRGFDVRTGERLWIFHTIPQPGEFGHESWLKGSAENTGNTGVWAQISVDEDLETVYLPVEEPTGDYFGANRPGDGLFGETLLAVDLYTGKRKWHYQLVHHGIWDNDIPCAPILIDVTVDGRRSRRSCTCSIARRASRSGRSSKSRCRKVTCRASGTRRRSRSPRSRPPTTGRASPRTTSSTSRRRCAKRRATSRPGTGWGRCSRHPSSATSTARWVR
jgi:quinoprotein glucose dehydrogenase